MAVRGRREGVWVVRKIICSCHMLLHNSVVLRQGLLLPSSSLRIFLLYASGVFKYLLFMELLLFFSPLFDDTTCINRVATTAAIDLERHRLREGQKR